MQMFFFNEIIDQLHSPLRVGNSGLSINYVQGKVFLIIFTYQL